MRAKIGYVYLVTPTHTHKIITLKRPSTISYNNIECICYWYNIDIITQCGCFLKFWKSYSYTHCVRQANCFGF